jgi:hypothetical protein
MLAIRNLLIPCSMQTKSFALSSYVHVSRVFLHLLNSGSVSKKGKENRSRLISKYSAAVKVGCKA